MKSENHLIITGSVISDVNPSSRHSFIRFRIVHSFGGGRKPLIQDCFQITKPEMEPHIPWKGDVVKIRAYLQMHGEKIEAIVKALDIEP